MLGLGALVVAKTVLPHQGKHGLAAEQAPGVDVVVASKDMKYGDKVDPDHLRLAHLPADAVPQGAYTTIAAVLSADHGGAPVVLTPITAREPILPLKLSGPGARASVAAEIAEGMRAYTIKVTDVSGVGGHALPGDRVDVVLLRDLNPNGPIHNYLSQVVLQDVRVLAIDLNADPATSKPATPNTATLEVSVADGQKLAVAADLGKLSLALRRTGAAEVAPTTVVRTSEFAGGAAAGPAGAAGPAVRRGGGAPGISVFRGILIVEGERRKGGGRAAVAPAPAPPPAPPAAPASASAQAATAGASAASLG